MRRLIRVLGLSALVVAATAAAAAQGGAAGGDVIAEVRAAIAAQDFARGEEILAKYRASRGETSESVAALSWLARGALAAKQLDRASQYSLDTYDLATAALGERRLETDRHLQTAIGAAIEVQALVRAARGARSDAVYYLQRELETYRDSPIHKRIQKNINLLSLEGQPAPHLEAGETLDAPLPPVEELKGKVVLLFFWAHWCPDCKAQGPILQKLFDKYRDRGLVLVAPTQRFGYIVSGQAATPEDELRHIVETRDKFYPFLRNQPVPVSAANHLQYGVSSTPTLALMDRQGTVRLYRPGRMTEQELEAAIQASL